MDSIVGCANLARLNEGLIGCLHVNRKATLDKICDHGSTNIWIQG